MPSVFMNPEGVSAITDIVTLVAVVLDLEVFSLDVINHVVSVFTSVATFKASILSGGVIAFHPQLDDLT